MLKISLIALTAFKNDRRHGGASAPVAKRPAWVPLPQLERRNGRCSPDPVVVTESRARLECFYWLLYGWFYCCFFDVFLLFCFLEGVVQHPPTAYRECRKNFAEEESEVNKKQEKASKVDDPAPFDPKCSSTGLQTIHQKASKPEASTCLAGAFAGAWPSHTKIEVWHFNLPSNSHVIPRNPKLSLPKKHI